jgi:tryptophan synthase alpha chain
MSRIPARFAALKEQGRKALIPFITAGDPHPDQTVALMHALVAGGADIVELGVPFSDPMADGPVIQRSSERALREGMNLRQVLDMVREFRLTDSTTPVVLMGYLNPIEVMGYEDFAEAAEAAGVDGALTVDLPPEEAEPLRVALDKYGLDPIFLVAPTTSEARLRQIAEVARGFLYYVSLKGVTGSDKLDVEAVARAVAKLRAQATVPIAVGFGVRDVASAAAVGREADGVVIGSSLVSRIEALGGEDASRWIPGIQEFIQELRRALDGIHAA